MPQTGVRTNIFGIGEVYELQREGLWAEKNRESYREFGYFVGGNVNILERLDFSNDTTATSNRGNLVGGNQFQAATGNTNFGYVNGGIDRTNVSRLNYSTEVSSLRTPTIISNGIGGACGNSNFGYFVGGTFPAVSRSIVQRIDYSNDLSTPSIRGPLTRVRFITAAAGNANFGYVYGSRNAESTIVDRIQYSNDSVQALARSNLPFQIEVSSATGNNSYGYWLGGSAGRTYVQRLDYANDTGLGSIRGPLSFGVSSHSTAMGNSNYGYVGGRESIIQRVDYSNDLVTANIRGKLSTVSDCGACSSASFGGAPVSYLGAPWTATSPFGYFGGGNNPGVPASYSTIDRVDYTNDTNTANVRGPLSLTRGSLTATGNSNFGYFGGGYIPGSGLGTLSTVDRIDYSNDSATASVRGSFNIGRRRFSASGNSNFGYFFGTSENISSIDRIDYNNDSATTSSRGNLSVGRRETSASGNINFGYIYGGLQPGGVSSVSIIERIDYSNDNVTLPVRNFLSFARFTTTATGNQNFGYIVNAFGTPALTQRIDYANDTGSVLNRGLISSGRISMGATGNSNFGYFGGGNNPGGTIVYSTIDRIDYSNDTQTASVRGPLSSGRSNLAASSSQAFGGAPNTTTDPLPVYIRDATKFDDSNTLELPFKRVLGSYGYFGGGDTGGTIVSRIDRIDYSNDTSTTSIRGPLGEIRSRTASTGTSNYGYIAMGRSGIPSPRKTSYQRIDYSNDTAISIIKTGGFNKELVDPAATGNSNFGYFAGGNDVATPSYSFISRLDYSADNDSPLVRALLSQNTYILAATGNSNFGYFGGGLTSPSPYYSTVNRLNYSNDTATASVRGALSIERGDLSATGNSNFGYFGGGRNPGVPAFYSTVDRIDYSNDTATASVRGPLSSSVYSSAATGNSNFGYFGGGRSGSLSTVDRVNYSNDTATASVRGPLSQSRYALAATTNARNS